jgi:3-hydroxyisobutyrate dehydrogenase-like beta-hydroxyacid dehydrogenase
MTTTPIRVGFIGLGIMGAPIASGLTAGKTVVDMSPISPIETKQFAQKINAPGASA